jgi:hypothetical protein
LSNDFDPIIVIRKIADFSNAIRQLRSRQCITVNGNVVSIVPTLLLEVLYGLQWRVVPFDRSFTERSPTMPQNEANVEIRFNNTRIDSRWVLDPNSTIFSVSYTINGNSFDESIEFHNENERISNCGKFFKSLIEKSLE